jgi:outer membrane protein assembly factor BamC
LELPPDLGGQTSTARVTPTAEDATAQQVSARQQEVLPQFDNISLKRDGDDRWLTINSDAGRVWPQVVDFFEKDGIKLVTKNPQTGVIETDWLENLAEIKTTLQRLFRRVFGKVLVADSYDKFRVRVDRGAEANTTEVFLSHRRIEAEEVPGENQKDVITVRWGAGKRSPDLEVEMLRLMMVYLGVEEEKAIQVAAAPSTEQTRQIASRENEDGGNDRLILDEDFSRAWRRVGISLDRIGFTIEDRDRSQGIYYLRSVDPEAAKEESESNFIKRLFTREKQIEFTSKVYVAAIEDRTEITVSTDGDDVDATNKRILDLLYAEFQ